MRKLPDGEHGVEITLTVHEKDQDSLKYSHDIVSKKKIISEKVMKSKGKAT